VDSPQQPSGGTSSIKPPVADRLDSWKAIAEYLRRDVRTVQRWEASEGLPVYRHRHLKHGTIYAYKSEIEAWWKARQPANKQRQPEIDQPRRSSFPSLEISYPQLAIYGVLIVVLAVSIAIAKQRFLTRRPAASSPAASQRPTVAVLPFQALSSASDDSNLALNVTEDLITALSHSKTLRVIDQGLTLRLEGSTESPQHIAQMLHSDRLLKGAVGRSGNDIRVVAQLIDPDTGETIWSRQFQRNAGDLLDVENEIANAIVLDVQNALGSGDGPQR
jgi:TolB-like protein